MRITYHIEGGIAHFPGLAQPRTIEVDALPKKTGEALRESATKALAAAAPKPSGRGADQRTFVITIESGRQKRTESIVEPAADPAWAALLQALQSANP